MIIQYLKGQELEQRYMNERAGLPRKISRVGVASFLIGLLTPLAIICLFLFSISLDSFLNGYQRQDFNLVLGLLIIFAPPLSHLVGLVLGIVGVCQTGRRKLFPILGIILNSLFLLAGAAVVIMVILLLWKAMGGFH